MAKPVTDTDFRRLVWDRIDGIPYPGEHQNLFGHDEALNKFAEIYSNGRMHHAWLISGQKGIGKASFALNIAGHIFRHPVDSHAPEQWVSPPQGDPIASRVGKGGHPNVLLLSRPWDPKTKKFRSALTVDEVRRTISFFGTTAGENSWRICIVDTADDMNPNAANALLKVLEEPPPRTIFLVLANAPGTLLPTIRSRCRHLALRSLGDADLTGALDALGTDIRSLGEDEQSALFGLCGGSVRRALILLRQDGLKLYKRFNNLLGAPGKNVPNWPEIHKLADELSRKNNEEQYRLLHDIARDHIGNLIHQGVADISLDNASNSVLSKLARMCEEWEETTKSAQLADSYNLDKKQVILNLFGSLSHLR